MKKALIVIDSGVMINYLMLSARYGPFTYKRIVCKTRSEAFMKLLRSYDFQIVDPTGFDPTLIGLLLAMEQAEEGEVNLVSSSSLLLKTTIKGVQVINAHDPDIQYVPKETGARPSFRGDNPVSGNSEAISTRSSDQEGVEQS